MTATVATHHLTLARQARDAGRLADCLSNATTAWGIAEAEKDRTTAWHAITCVGRAYLAAEIPAEALRWHREAFEYARANDLVALMAGSAHDRYLSALACGQIEEAHRSAGTAYDLYGFRGRRISCLTMDRSLEQIRDDPGYTYHACRAFFADADNHRDRMFALGNMVDAASYLRSDRLFDDHWPTLRAYLDPEMERAGMFYAVAAEGLLRRDRVEEGRALAERAVDIAIMRGEGVARERAECALSCADSARVPEP